MSRSVVLVLAAAFGAAFALVPSVRSEDGPGAEETSWVSIEDDPSRMALFDAMIAPPKADGDKPVDLGIPKVFYFPDDARNDVILGKPRQGSIFGVDVSHYTHRELNHRALRIQEVRFVYVKATQGVRFKDGLFGDFWKRLHALEDGQAVSVGAYHFLTAGTDGVEQAKRFLDYVRLHGGIKPMDMPPCLDLEWDRTSNDPDRWTGVSAEEAVSNAVAWLEYVEQETGRRPLLYTARAWLDGRGIRGEVLAKLTKYPIWIADYSNSHKAVEKPSVPAGVKPVIWQFTADARLTTGYQGGLDANIYYGSEEDFVKDFGLTR